MRRYVGRVVSIPGPSTRRSEPAMLPAGAAPAPGAARPAAGHYGSAAGELAACDSAVGLGNCSHLVKLGLAGDADRLAGLLRRLTGMELAPGGATFAAGAWWAAPEAGQVIVLAPPPARRRLLQALAAALAPGDSVTVADRTADWSVLAVAGELTVPVLAALGVYGEDRDPRRVPPVLRHPLAGAPALWLLQSDQQALVVVDAGDIAAAWNAIERAGRPLGLCAVGHDALVRYALAVRARAGL